MSVPAGPEPPDGGDLQFDIAEPAAGSRSAATGARPTTATRPTSLCAGCKRPITSSYFTVGKRIACADCIAKLKAGPGGSRTGRIGLATLYGIGAAIAGAIIWYAIRIITHLEIGYVAILVGFMVGAAVLKGSGNRGGRAYQFLAIVLTYCSIAGNYAPDVVEALIADYHSKHPAAASAQPPAAVAATDAGIVTAHAATQKADQAATKLAREIGTQQSPPKKPAPSLGKAFLALALLIVLVIGITLAAPFFGGVSNILGLLIIGLALVQAWRMNRARIPAIGGPFQIGQRPPGSVA